jgi:REP element-mobilizing transposase RayT
MSQLIQEGRTRYTHYSIAYHLVWIPKYRRKILVGDIEAETLLAFAFFGCTLIKIWIGAIAVKYK